MTIQEYISHYLRQKLHDKRTLLIYDGSGRYRDLAKGMATEKTQVFDVAESTINSREDALDHYRQVLPFQPEQRMVVYVPRAKPVRAVDQIRDPFWPFQFGGCLFPDGPQDDYDELCRACFPAKEAQLEQLFQQEPLPAFETINTLGGGQVYARLQTLTGGQSEREILLGILLPPDSAAFERDRHFLKEWRTFSKAVLGYKKADTDRDKDLLSIQQNLWQFLLFSEFVYDLPAEKQSQLPGELVPVSRGAESQKSLILALCSTLRDSQRYQDLYRDQANRVADALDLPHLFSQETDLGHRVTFDFEDRHYINQVVNKLLAGQLTEAEQLLRPNSRSLWANSDLNRQQHWQFTERVYELLSVPTLPPTTRTLKAVIAEYTQRGYRLDQLHRQLETLWQEIAAPDTILEPLLNFARATYRDQSEVRQRAYQGAVEAEGYPQSADLPTTTSIFDKQVTPLLQAGKRVAYLLIDAFRYELIKETESALLRTGQVVQVDPYLTVLPSYTKLGMAALLPDADQGLKFIRHQDNMEAVINDTVLKNRADREQFLRNRFGDQVQMLELGQFLSRPQVADTVKLLVLTTTDLDKAGENLAGGGLSVINSLLRKLTQVLQPLKQAKFDSVLMATDHGFVWQSFSPGDKVVEPAGNWLLRKHRVLMGEGADSSDTLSFVPNFVGIRTDQPRITFARQFAAFQRNVTYFHEGLSMQENVVGLLTIALKTNRREIRRTWQLTYRGQQTGSITTRRPAVDVAVFVDDQLFAEPVTVFIDVLNGQRIVVGKAALDDPTGLLTLQPGNLPQRITLWMDEDYEGAFVVRLTDPASGVERAAITLQTNYAS
jgi:hypothetical protein